MALAEPLHWGLPERAIERIFVPAQLAGRGVIDNVFSLCFGSVEGDGALMLGDVDLSEQDIELRYTTLLSSAAHPHYYSIRLESLWVGDVELAVRPVSAAPMHRLHRPCAACVPGGICPGLHALLLAGGLSTSAPAARCCSKRRAVQQTLRVEQQEPACVLLERGSCRV